MRIICLDIGTQSCGFAITDVNQKIANPLENYLYSKNDKVQVINRLKYWIKEYLNEIKVILIGLPLDVNGFEIKMTKYVNEVLALIKDNEAFNKFEIITFDERYSTKEGSELLMQLDIKASLRKKLKDKMAAYVILENYLNFIRRK